jgi:PAS domain S-box-containing protein
MKKNSRYLQLIFTMLSVLIVSFSGYFLWNARQSALELAEQQTQNNAALISAHLEETLQHIDTVLGVYAHDFPKEVLDQRAVAANQTVISSRMSRLMENIPVVSGTYFFDSHGDMLFTSDPQAKTANVADQPFFQTLRDQPKTRLAFSDALIARTTGRWSLVIARAVRDDQGVFLGVTTALLDLGYAAEQFSKLRLSATAVLSIRRSDSTNLILRLPFVAGFMNVPLPPSHLVRQAVESGQGFHRVIDVSPIDHVRRIISFDRLNFYPFFVQAGLFIDDVLAVWRQQVYWSMGVISSLLILSEFGLSRLSRAEHLESLVAERTAEVIVAQNRAEQALKYFCALFEQAPLGIAVVDADSQKIRQVNQLYAEIVGRSRDEIVGLDWVTLTHPDDVQGQQEQLARLERDGVPIVRFDKRYLHPDGTVVWGSLTMAALAVGPEDRSQYLYLVEDITERKRFELALAESEARFRMMADSAPVLIWVSDIDKHCTWFNRGWLEFTGRTMEQELGEGWLESVHPDDLQTCLEIYVTSFDQRQRFRMEYRLKRKDGEYRWITDSGVPLFDAVGQFTGYIGSCIDITEHKDYESRLELSARVFVNAREAIAKG